MFLFRSLFLVLIINSLFGYYKSYSQCIVDFETIPLTTVNCEPFGIQFRDKSTGAVQSRIWNFGDNSALIGAQNPTHTYTTSGINTTFSGSLNITCTGGLTGQKRFTIITNAKPKGNFTKNKLVVCSISDSVTFTPAFTTPGLTYDWNFGDNTFSNLSTVSHKYYASGKYQVLLNVSTPQGCTQVFGDTIKVNPTPNPDFDITRYDGCVPASIAIKNNTSSQTDSIVSWIWRLGNSTFTGKNPPEQSFESPGNYQFSLKTTNTYGCSNTTEISRSFSQRPTITGVTYPSTVCPYFNAVLSVSTPSTGVTYEWDLGSGAQIVSGANSSSITVRWSTGGTKTVKARVRNNACVDERVFYVYVYDYSNLSFIYSDNKSTACEGDNKTITVVPTGLSNYTFTNQLNNNIIQTGTSNTISFNNLRSNINYIVTATSDKGCVFTANPNLKITVAPVPSVKLISIPSITSGLCEAEAITLSAITTVSGIDFLFYFNNLTVQRGALNTYNFTTSGVSSFAYVKAMVNGCEALSNSISFSKESDVNPPIVNCGLTSENIINFNWTEVPGGTKYEVSINGGAYITPTSGLLGSTHSIGGLNVNDSITLNVRALTNSKCSPVLISNNQKCYAIDCPELKASISLDKSYYCPDENVIANYNILTSSSNKIKGSWYRYNGQLLGSGSPITIPGTGFIPVLSSQNLYLTLRDSTVNPKCPAFNTNSTTNLRSQIQFSYQTKTTSFVGETFSSKECVELSYELKILPGFNEYKFETDNGITLVTTVNSFNYLESNTLDNIRYVNATVFDGYCYKTQKIDLHCTHFFIKDSIPSCLRREEDPQYKRPEYEITIVGTGFKNYTFLDKSLPLPNDTIYTGHSNTTIYTILGTYTLIQVYGETFDGSIITTRKLIYHNYFPVYNFDVKVNLEKCGYLNTEIQVEPKNVFNYILSVIIPPDVNPKLKAFSDSGYVKYVDNLNYGPYKLTVNGSTKDIPICTTSKYITIEDKKFRVSYETDQAPLDLVCRKDFRIVPKIIDFEYDTIYKDDSTFTYKTKREFDPYDGINYNFYEYKWTKFKPKASLMSVYNTSTFLVSDTLSDRNRIILGTVKRKYDDCIRLDTAAIFTPKVIPPVNTFDIKYCLGKDSLNLISLYNKGSILKGSHAWSNESWIPDRFSDTLKLVPTVAKYTISDTICFYNYFINTNKKDPEKFVNPVMTLFKFREINPYNICVIKCAKNPVIPNVITPNEDGVNDLWRLSEFNEKVNVAVFNRWGDLVFESDDYKNTWEGKTKNGNNLPNGIYYYVIKPEGAMYYKGEVNGNANYSCDPTPYKEFKGTLLIER